MDEDQKKLAEELLDRGGKERGFVGEVFRGFLAVDEFYPFPVVGSREERKFIAETIEFARKEIDAHKIDKEQKIPERVIRGLAEKGVLGMTLPREAGGLGFSQLAFCRFLEELAAICGSTALFVNVHQSIGLRALLLFGSEEQKKKWLPALAKGEIISAFALTEESAGSDASAIETKAVFDRDRNVYRLTGAKKWITNGAIAGFLTVMAKVEGKITAFIVTPDMPGFHVEIKNAEKLGMRGTVTSFLRFNGMEVPAENILGTIGGGLKIALTVLDYGRSAFGATCSGVAKELVKRAVEHAIKRHQFKKPLAFFPLIKEKIAKMRALAFATQSTAYLTARLIDAGKRDFMLEAAILKVFASEALWQIAYDAMQILGGRSFFTDEPYERMMRDARLNMIGEGANEVLRIFIAAAGFREKADQLKRPLSLIKSFFSRKIMTNRAELRSEARSLRRAVGKLSIATTYLLIKHRKGIIDKQAQLNRLASMAIAIFTQAAVLSRLETMDEKEVDFATGKFYCHLATAEFWTRYKETARNFDSEIEDLSCRITGV